MPEAASRPQGGGQESEEGVQSRTKQTSLVLRLNAKLELKKPSVASPTPSVIFAGQVTSRITPQKSESTTFPAVIRNCVAPHTCME